MRMLKLGSSDPVVYLCSWIMPGAVVFPSSWSRLKAEVTRETIGAAVNFSCLSVDILSVGRLIVLSAS